MSNKGPLRVTQTVVNNSANQTSPRPPLHASASLFDRRGARAKGSQLAPLLVLTRFEAHKQLTRNQSHGVTPFWHNDTPLPGNSYFWRTAAGGAMMSPGSAGVSGTTGARSARLERRLPTGRQRVDLYGLAAADYGFAGDA
jgi:hypothetical protein